MKTELALVSLLALTGAALFFFPQQTLSAGQSDVFQSFVNWKATHGDFSNDNDAFRFAMFAQNYELVKEFNRKSTNAKLSVEGPFAVLSNEEYRAKVLTNRPHNRNVTYAKRTNKVAEVADEIDWISKGAVNPIQDQGNCGSCWAFSAIASLEGLNEIQDGTLQKFSEQQLVSCAKFPNSGCNGGLEETAMEQTASTGVELESTYPYTSGSTGKSGTCEYEESEVVWHNKGANMIPNNANVKTAILEQLNEQPISIAVDAGGFGFQLYSSGVLTESECAGSQLNHAINVVGYTQSGSEPYWLIRNSWGTSWGLKGYAHFALVDGTKGVCSMYAEPSYPF